VCDMTCVVSGLEELDERVRSAAFAHLRALALRTDGLVRFNDVFTFDGVPIRYMVQTGIWKPAMLAAALSIRTVYAARPDQRRMTMPPVPTVICGTSGVATIRSTPTTGRSERPSIGGYRSSGSSAWSGASTCRGSRFGWSAKSPQPSSSSWRWMTSRSRTGRRQM
jgi:hypothetical protein